MAEPQHRFSTLAAVGIWLVAVVGALVLVGAIVGAWLSATCDAESTAGSAPMWAWVMFAIASVVPAMVMTAIAGRARRQLTSLAVGFGAIELVVLGVIAQAVLDGCVQ